MAFPYLISLRAINPIVSSVIPIIQAYTERFLVDFDESSALKAADSRKHQNNYYTCITCIKRKIVRTSKRLALLRISATD